MQRHFESKRFGGPEVNNQLEFDGCLNGKLARLLALEDTINIGRGQPKLVTLVAAVGKQPTGLGEEAPWVNRRKMVAFYQRNDFSPNFQKPTRKKNKATIRRASHF